MKSNELKKIEVLIYPDGRMDTENAAIYLGESLKTLAMKRSQGTGPKFIKSGRIFYYQDDLDDYLMAGGKCMSTAQQRQAKNNVVGIDYLAKDNRRLDEGF